MIELVALLGNPGIQYRRTRHNAAWLFAQYCGWDGLSWKAKWGAHYADVAMSGTRFTVLKPQKFMNRSGESIAQFARFKRIDPKSMLVVHDDVELAFGDVVVKSGGGLAGHNGLKSLAERIGSRDFIRLRIGIGRPSHGTVSSFVLKAFTKSEERQLPELFARADQLLAETLTEK
jgi:peptidyl-tRNA hydrolase, PTH1 family